MAYTSRKIAGTALTLTLLLAACNPDPVPAIEPVQEVLTAPTAPVASNDTDLSQTPVVAQRAQLAVQGLLTQSELTPELYEVLNTFGLTGGLGMASFGNETTMLRSPLELGRSLLGGVQGRGLAAQGTTVVAVNKLRTGTYEIDANSQLKQLSSMPADGYVEHYPARNLKIVAEWKVGGAATTTFDTTGYDPATGQFVPQQQEISTNARVTMSRLTTGVQMASATFNMTPGACLSQTGPDALKLNLWAGKASTPELTASLDYAWNDQAVTLKLAGALKGKTKGMDASSSLEMKGSTAHRCDPATFSFTPTKLDASASVNVPGDRLKADLKLRDLSNLVFSTAELKVQNPFARVQGKIRASAEHNDKTFFSAFGPLADGADLDLIPGDGVEVKYVQNGTLVTTNLQGFVASLASTLR